MLLILLLFAPYQQLQRGEIEKSAILRENEKTEERGIEESA
jgi:hypothetical protein